MSSDASTLHSSHQWISEDAEVLAHLDDLSIATPRFSAPEEITSVQQFTYHRLHVDASGEEIGRIIVQVLVYPNSLDGEYKRIGDPQEGGVDHSCNEPETCLILDVDRTHAQQDVYMSDRFAPVFPDDSSGEINRHESPVVHCPLSVTADGGTEIDITCFGQNPTGGLIQYIAEFDWPPYRQSVVLEGGEFDYTIRVPSGTQLADVRRLELTALDPKTGVSAKQDIELHIVNNELVFDCQDLEAREGELVRLPCDVQVEGPLQFQVIPQSNVDGIPAGVYDHVPQFVAPDVQGDMAIPMIVRVVETGAKRLTERRLSLFISDTSDQTEGGGAPLDLMIDCGPVNHERYEGGDDIVISCDTVGEQDVENFVWTWSAEGDTPFELLEFNSGREVVYLTPESVDGDVTHEYTVTASSEQEGVSNQVIIQIIILERPDIFVECEDAFARVGDPPIQLSCTATNDKQLPDLDYVWSWNPTDRLSGNLSTTGTPIFNVPASLTEESVTYTYRVTASALNADPPDMATELNVTVENFFGMLSLSCMTPIVVYEGSGDFELDCTVGNLENNEPLTWDWQLISGPSDLLTANPDSERGPIFSVPESVDQDQTYVYEVSIRAPRHDDSESIPVAITVLNRPVLALDCENEIVVQVGDPPREITCAVSNDEEEDLEYTWLWSPTTRLSDVNTSTPVFNVPQSQTVDSEEYNYEVTVSAPNAISASASVRVTVENFFGMLSLSCVTPIVVYEGSEDFELDCIVEGLQDNRPLTWDWQLISGPSDLLTANPDSERGPIFAVPESVDEDQMYEYEVFVRAPRHDDSESIPVAITVLKRPVLALDCENEIVVQVGDPPREITCEVSNDKGEDLEYTWLWSPTTRLSDVNTSTPVFDVPQSQRVASEDYNYEVFVGAPNAILVSASVRVTVINPGVATLNRLDVNFVPLDFGIFGSAGIARFDPSSEEVAGVTYGGTKHAGRMVFTARDSLSLGLELYQPAILRHEGGSGVAEESVSVTLNPLWSYVESCNTLANEVQAGTSLSIVMESGDCRQLLFGGEVNLDGAEPGIYSGEIFVLVTTDNYSATHSVPVSLTVERERRVINLGSRGVRFDNEIEAPISLESDQSIRIYPLTAVLSPSQTAGVFEVSNPSVIPLTVTVKTSFGYLAAQTPEDRERLVPTDIVDQPDSSLFGDLSSIIQIHPSTLNLSPGESKEVRYAVKDANLSWPEDRRAYAMFFDFEATPRQYVRVDQLPSPLPNYRTATISTRIPSVYIPEWDLSQPMMAVLESSSDLPDGGLSVTLLIEAPETPFAGKVVVLGENGVQIGQTDLLVYTQSRVRVQLTSSPGEYMTLQFMPHADLPAPASIRIPVEDS